ncbi:MAG: bifunctional methylenetetrahydrofolate dehydrogenase/methenyltetrahydrofolate cyclohydrolase FolD [Gammaproteobacteria bacterium]|nr:bifunctional methylenetetrahydrofolate dehydrogenase/methenyltetrahydrofolate cyclohydrolase FolD [Gammaproteobacteria bacterium]
MPAQILDGRSLAATLRAEVAADIKARLSHGFRAPCIAVILVGDDPASAIYVRNKHNACEEVGMHSLKHTLPDHVSEKMLLDLIHTLNQDEAVDGILLQLPLPPHINADQILEAISPQKDIDGFHPYNLGRLAQRRPALRPCTPYGIMELLKVTGDKYKNRHAVIVGASNIVGRPMALELLLAGCTITVCHRFTQDLSVYVSEADILVSAVGKPGIIQGEWIKPDSTVIDVGMNRLPNGTLTGDVEFTKASERAAWITPVPGGVGPMTIAMLLKNTLQAATQKSS